MKKNYFSPLINETVVGVEVGFCGSKMSVVNVGFSEDSHYVTMEGDE